MKTLKSFKHTRIACYTGSVTQAIIVNFAPLLFLTFEKDYNIPLSQITVLIALNFITQLTVDCLSAKFVPKIGYRPCIVTAHILCAAGLLLLGLLPPLLPSAFAGLVISVIIYAIGGGLIEVLVTPITESCPSDSKAASMGLAHSFFSWGSVFAIVVSTLFFATAGIENWRYLAYCWAIVPAANAVYFSIVPINPLAGEEEKGGSVGELFKSGKFWFFFFLMMLSGACEIGMSQWASAFAESALVTSPLSQYAKTLGDLMGPCFFAVMMGISRVLYSALTKKADLRMLMIISTSLCVCCYLLTSLSQDPIIALVGCGLCGFSVGIMWPGTCSLAAATHSGGSTALFALLAVGGDLGCTVGPAVVGTVSDLFGGNLSRGFLIATAIPTTLLICLAASKKVWKKKD